LLFSLISFGLWGFIVSLSATMPRVICLGEILVDRIASQVDADLENEALWHTYAGGAPANVAVNLAKLGVEVGLVGCVGQDQAGEFLLDFLRSAGVDTTQIKVLPHAETRQVFVARDSKGERHFVKTTGNADLFLAPHHLAPQYWQEAEFLVLGTVLLANVGSSRAVGRALKLAEEAFVRVVVDLNWRPLFWEQPQQARQLIPILIRHADFLKLSYEEAFEFFHTGAPSAIAQQFHHLEGVIVTEGERGCRYVLGGRQSRCPALPVPVVDTTGAGDAFVAGFVAQLLQVSLKELNQPVIAHEIIRFATAMGALATTCVGAIHPELSRAKIEQMLGRA
jgi:fructokinase